jgi:broad specificity phosphatase PhoE
VKPSWLLLVRHGRTEANRGGFYAGRSDVPLDELGRTQAGAVARRLARERVAAVYASPMQRTLETAEPIARAHGLEVQPIEELAELSMPGWQGLGEKEIAERFPVEWQAWMRNPAALDCRYIESLSSLGRRVRHALGGIGRRHEGEAAVVVSHEAVLRVAILLSLGLELRAYRRLRVAPGSLSALAWSPEGSSLMLLSDSSHQDEGRLSFLAGLSEA